MALSPWPPNDGTQIPALSAATFELGRALALHTTLDAQLIFPPRGRRVGPCRRAREHGAASDSE